MRAYTLILGFIIISVEVLISEQKAGLDWWSFQKITRPEIPKSDKVMLQKPIDAFIRSKQQKNNIQPSPLSSPEVLIKRVYYDLVGLPPSYERVQNFIFNKSDNAYEKLVDDLLGSSHFGERWARHWLDVVRYAETNGYERDEVKPNIWKYRDWVIKAFNSDMPYDQFVKQQLAGDEIDIPTESSVIATGMLRAGTWNDEPNDPQEYKYERLEDMVDVVSTAFLGLTVRCARCHDHKFDPIPQVDYYRMAAAFWGGTIDPGDRSEMGGPNDKQLGFKKVFGWTDVHKNPPPIHLLMNGDPDKKSFIVQPGHLSLVKHLNRPIEDPPKDSKTSWRRRQLAEYITHTDNPLTSRVIVNRIWQHLMGKGIVTTPNNFGFKSASPTHPELLDWLASEFVEGGWSMKKIIKMIVMSETYKQSSTHPNNMECTQIDPDNRLLWKRNIRRMDAEVLRDSLLQVSGDLNLKKGGESFYPSLAPEVLEGFSRKSSAWTPSPEKDQLRRSVYMISKRHLLIPFMKAFDFPSSEKPCGNRNRTTVVSQSLAMLNNQFIHSRSSNLARVLIQEHGEDEDAIFNAWKQIFSREPKPHELEASLKHYHKQQSYFSEKDNSRLLALSSVCHVLINSNEFLYID